MGCEEAIRVERETGEIQGPGDVSGHQVDLRLDAIGHLALCAGREEADLHAEGPAPGHLLEGAVEVGEIGHEAIFLGHRVGVLEAARDDGDLLEREAVTELVQEAQEAGGLPLEAEDPAAERLPKRGVHLDALSRAGVPRELPVQDRVEVLGLALGLRDLVHGERVRLAQEDVGLHELHLGDAGQDLLLQGPFAAGLRERVDGGAAQGLGEPHAQALEAQELSADVRAGLGDGEILEAELLVEPEGEPVEMDAVAPRVEADGLLRAQAELLQARGAVEPRGEAGLLPLARRLEVAADVDAPAPIPGEPLDLQVPDQARHVRAELGGALRRVAAEEAARGQGEGGLVDARLEIALEGQAPLAPGAAAFDEQVGRLEGEAPFEVRIHFACDDRSAALEAEPDGGVSQAPLDREIPGVHVSTDVPPDLGFAGLEEMKDPDVRAGIRVPDPGQPDLVEGEGGLAGGLGERGDEIRDPTGPAVDDPIHRRLLVPQGHEGVSGLRRAPLQTVEAAEGLVLPGGDPRDEAFGPLPAVFAHHGARDADEIVEGWDAGHEIADVHLEELSLDPGCAIQAQGRRARLDGEALLEAGVEVRGVRVPVELPLQADLAVGIERIVEGCGEPEPLLETGLRRVRGLDGPVLPAEVDDGSRAVRGGASLEVSPDGHVLDLHRRELLQEADETARFLPFLATSAAPTQEVQDPPGRLSEVVAAVRGGPDLDLDALDLHAEEDRDAVLECIGVEVHQDPAGGEQRTIIRHRSGCRAEVREHEAGGALEVDVPVGDVQREELSGFVLHALDDPLDPRRDPPEHGGRRQRGQHQDDGQQDDPVAAEEARAWRFGPGGLGRSA